MTTFLTNELKKMAIEVAKKYDTPSVLHPEDQLLRHIVSKWGGVGIGKYFEGGRVDAQKVKRLIMSLGHSNPKLKILDFAAGFGRVTRHLKTILPEHEIMASDIHPQACKFLKEEFEISAFVSETNPADIVIGDEYDVIFTLSFFSHIPDKTFGPWMAALYERLAPGGYLFFTANGRNTLAMYPEFFGIIPKGGRFGYRTESDQHDLDGDDYGSMIITLGYMVEKLEEFIPDAILHSYSSGGWVGTQDGWVLKKPI